MIRQLRALEAAQVVMVIDLMKTMRGDRNREDTVRFISNESSTADAVAKRQSHPAEFLEELWAAVERCGPEIRAAVIGYISGLAGQSHGRLEKSFEDWIDKHDVKSDSFAKRCANENGNFLIFRCFDGQACDVAEMRVTYDQTTTLMPQFETTFFKAGAAHAQVKGVLFEVGNYAYAIGKSVNNRAMRFSKLRPYTRPSGETDLYGLRVANSNGANRPYAHFIYCYQLKRKRSAQKLKKLLAVTDIMNDLLDQEIDEIAEIRALLLETEITENGIVAKSFGD